MRVIDFRVRPPIAGFESGRMYSRPERTAQMGKAFGFAVAPRTLREPSVTVFEAELQESGIELAVVPGRVGAPDVGPANNDALIEYGRSHARRICVFPAVDPTVRDWRTTAETLLRVGGPIVKGLTLEPGLLAKPVYPDDEVCHPVYEFCADRGLPVILSAGGNVGPDCSYTFPAHFDRVARDFPRLNIVIAHGGWPWITATLHVAFRRGNVFISPDMYAFMPGNEAYTAAMNSYLSERFVYASSYPFVPLQGYLEYFLKVVANDSVAERVLFSNAAGLLRVT